MFRVAIDGATIHLIRHFESLADICHTKPNIVPQDTIFLSHLISGMHRLCKGGDKLIPPLWDRLLQTKQRTNKPPLSVRIQTVFSRIFPLFSLYLKRGKKKIETKFPFTFLMNSIHLFVYCLGVPPPFAPTPLPCPFFHSFLFSIF